MTIGEILALQTGAPFISSGIAATVSRVAVIPFSRESTDDRGNPIVLDLSYVELVYQCQGETSAMYAGPSIRMNLEIAEYEAN